MRLAIPVAAIAILNASSIGEAFETRVVNKPASLFDTELCGNASAVEKSAPDNGCRHVDELQVELVSFAGPVAMVRTNGMIRFAPSQRVLINCHGTSVTLSSYISGRLPPGLKKC